MGRTSIKNQLILSFLWILLIVMVVVGVVNWVAEDFYLAQAISAALALVVGVVFGSVFSKSFVKRLNSLSDIAREISKGDLSKSIPILSMDEIRNLEEIFASMVGDLRGMIAETRTVSEQITQTNVRLSQLAKQVLQNSHEIDVSAQGIAKGSGEQNHIVQKTSLNLDSGLNTMEEMVKQSAQTVAKVNEARLKTEVGETRARQTLIHLEEVLKQMAEYTQPIYRLANKIEKIKMVINVMNGIAQKTDLLSLNASIEATRAGESGRGFALVADEIRSMAASSKQSSEEIRKMVEDILEENREVMDTLTKSKEGINKGREIIHGIVNTFGEMLSGVKDIFAEIKEIEEVTGKQVSQLRGLTKHFQELSRLANENFVATQKTTVATKNQKEDMVKMVKALRALNALSEKMMASQQRFKLD